MNDNQSFSNGVKIMPSMKDKRSIILKSAKELFDQYGIENTRISAIVKKSKIAQGTFYLYFKSKQDLLSKLSIDSIQEYSDYLKEHTDVEQGVYYLLEISIDRIITMSKDSPKLTLIVFASVNEVMEESDWEMLYEPLRTVLKERLLYSMKAGDVRSDLNVEYTITFIISLIESTAKRFITVQQDDDIDRYKKELIEFIMNAIQ